MVETVCFNEYNNLIKTSYNFGHGFVYCKTPAFRLSIFNILICLFFFFNFTLL